MPSRATKIVATLGRFSMNYFNENLKISKDHGKIFRMDGRLLIPLYHPAAILRNMGLIGEYEKDFKKLPKAAAKFRELIREGGAGKV